MNLIEATAILAILIIIIVAGLFLLMSKVPQPITEAKAIEIIEQDLQGKYPGAIIELSSVSPSTYSGSWHVVVNVVTNASSPCPSYFVYSYDYPKFSLIPTNITTYATNCHAIGAIASYPAAIDRATSLNLSSVINYIKEYGYGNVIVSANFFNSTKLNNATYYDIWLVNYTAKNASHYVVVAITGLNGSFVTAFNVTR